MLRPLSGLQCSFPPTPEAILLSPMLAIRLSKVGTFVVSWLVAAVIYALMEYGILGDLTYYPSTGNPYDLRTGLVGYSLAATAIGALLGMIEVFWLSDRFRGESFGKRGWVNRCVNVSGGVLPLLV